MKKKLFVLIVFISFGSYAQGEANIWYFGRFAGLDFNSGSPVALTDGKLDTDEGCATLSDSQGKLLFYTDGISVWNKNHQIMTNGNDLLGHSSSTQSATIVQKPNSPNLFYVFTIDSEVGINGFRYSIIDISLNNGLGDVTDQKNILVYSPTCEKIAVIKNNNNSGFWIVTHGWNNNTFYAHSLTETGLNPVPAVSNTGVSVYKEAINSHGYMKISPDGSKLAVANNSWDIPTTNLQLFDFNTTSGLVTNPRTLVDGELKSYGVEFSPNSELLYYSSFDFNSLYQFDTNAANIALSKISLGPTIVTPAALQLGPDGKIYISSILSNTISVINNPNSYGFSCDLQMDAIDLGGKIALLGLPAFNQSIFFNPSIEFDNKCLGQTTLFKINTSQTITSAFWNFGDGSTSTDVNPYHEYLSTGNYTVSVTATSATGTTTKTRDVTISAIPNATKPQDLFVCDINNDGFHSFDLTLQNTSILNGQDPDLYSVNYFINNIPIATPNSYTNLEAYQQYTISAEVFNIANGQCKNTTDFTIDVFDTPEPALSANIPKLTSCDNTSVGTDTDNRVIFDLTQRATTILNGQSASQFLLSYYRDVALTQNIALAMAYQNSNPTETIYVKMTNKDNVNCFEMTSFMIEVLTLPTITNVVDLKQCDEDVDGFSIFNLEESIDKITTTASTDTITFFKSLVEAENNLNPILNPTTFTNQTVSVDKVFVKVTNSNACFRIAQLNLIVSTTQIPTNFVRTFAQCDDLISGTNTDGIASFDFSSVTNDIQAIFPTGQLLAITYYKNIADALAEKNAITDIVNYSNIGYPKNQNIFIRVDSKLNNDCLGLGGYITLTVESIPIIAPIEPITHCDDNQDGSYAFDVTSLDNKIKNGKDVTVAYFDSSNNPLPSPLPNPFVTAPQTLKITITNNTNAACSYNTSISFIVDDLPEAFPIATTLTTVCDDEANPIQHDGKYAFDTSSFQNTILGEQTGMIIYYFDKNNTPLPSPLPNPFITGTQNVRVEVMNPINTNCSTTTLISFKVNPIPNISLQGDELVCSNLPTFTKVIDAGIQDGSPTENYNYVWSFNGSLIIGEIEYTLNVNTEGIYTVVVTNNQGCSRSRTITVSASDIAFITNVNIVDLADANSISISVTGNGDYVYALDDEFDVYQDEPVFTNVSAGIHTVFVKDLNGCGIVPKEVAILGIPNYFTPNQDGYNDTWNMKGINTSFNTKTRIQIYDRYGKLVHQLNPTGEGWDGTFMGQPMPADDYWYSIHLEDSRVMKGHFALKR